MSTRFVYAPQSLQSNEATSPDITELVPNSSLDETKIITEHSSNTDSSSSNSCKVHYFQLWQCARDNAHNDGSVVVLAQETKVVSPLSVEEQLAQQDLYKTELCRSFMATGKCPYGKRCRFAHGIDELRPVLRHPKYKTQICSAFAHTGYCPYGISLLISSSKFSHLHKSLYIFISLSYFSYNALFYIIC